jgi:hypothetical protein
MTADESREVQYRLDILKLAGEHSLGGSSQEDVIARAQAYLTFTEAGRQKDQDR